MLRGFDYGLLAALGVALAHGVAWSVVGLTFGLLAVAVAGGWLIGYALKQGVASHRRRGLGPSTAADTDDGGPYIPPPRGMSTLAAALGLLAFVAGSFVAFAIVQVGAGGSGVLDPSRFADHLGQALTMEPTWLQPAVLAAYVVVAWLSARPSLPRPAKARR